MGMAPERELSGDEQEWLRVRDALRERRYELSFSAAEDYPDTPKLAGQPLLSTSAWALERPLSLENVELAFDPGAGFSGISGTEPAASSALPRRQDGTRYERYSEAVGELAAPRVFEDRSTYRLVEAELSAATGRLVFGRGTYFDGTDTGEACAHEYVAQGVGPLRRAIGDPCVPSRRPVNLAISTLTIRHDRATGEATFWLHWRDPAKVGHAGGLFQVLPVGIFQPSGAARWNESNDFSLWRNVVREFAEEFRGVDEDHGSETAPIDYDAWPFARALNEGFGSGTVRAYCLGLGVDPLTLATDLLTAVVFDAPLFDQLFGDLVTDNEEGHVLPPRPFDSTTIEHFARHQPMQAAGAALLGLAGTHRSTLLA
ncbi:hypothetical protein GCM10027174_45570 [Salinifilum aidingensis]